MTKLLSIVCLSAIGVATSYLAVAQESPPEAGKLQTPFNVRGHEVPRYFAVEAFFDQAFLTHRAGDDWFEYNILIDMGVEPGSRGAKVIERATLLAGAVQLETLSLGPYENDPGGWDEAQRGFQREHARSLARIYREMLVDLRAEGIERSVVEGFIDREILPGLSVLSSEDLDSPRNKELFQLVEEEFQLELSKY